jgi:hypothetical protein
MFVFCDLPHSVLPSTFVPFCHHAAQGYITYAFEKVLLNNQEITCFYHAPFILPQAMA